MADEVDVSKHMEDIKKWCKDPEKLLEYERKMKKAIKWNRENDEFLRTSNFVPDDLWKKFVNAINYDSATTVGWATNKLSILYKRTQLGEKIYVPSLNVNLERCSFEEIICKEFSRFIFNLILKEFESN